MNKKNETVTVSKKWLSTLEEELTKAYDLCVEDLSNAIRTRNKNSEDIVDRYSEIFVQCGYYLEWMVEDGNQD